MFKIKKSNKRIGNRDPLIETHNQNEESTQSQKFKGRPQSVRVNRKTNVQSTNLLKDKEPE